MIDLHAHTFFSDGVLIPSELARRAESAGLAGIAITDHGDSSNIDFIVPRIISLACDLNRFMKIKVIPGIELTHVPSLQIADCARRARNLGAKIIIVHGETIVEPVASGTNRAAIDAGVDILAHPGLISVEDVLAARDKGVLLEITARKGHSLTNGHVARLAAEAGAKLVINTDTHDPSDLVNRDQALKIVLGAGLTESDFVIMQQNASAFM